MWVCHTLNLYVTSLTTSSNIWLLASSCVSDKEKTISGCVCRHTVPFHLIEPLNRKSVKEINSWTVTMKFPRVLSDARVLLIKFRKTSLQNLMNFSFPSRTAFFLVTKSDDWDSVSQVKRTQRPVLIPQVHGLAEQRPLNLACQRALSSLQQLRLSAKSMTLPSNSSDSKAKEESEMLSQKLNLCTFYFLSIS